MSSTERMHPIRRIARALLVPAALTVVAIAGCGGSGDTAQTPITFTRVGVENADSASVTLVWETSEPTTAVIEYGQKPDDLDQEKKIEAMVTTHRIQVTDLGPDTTYFFRVRALAGDREVESEIQNARTTPAPKFVEAPQGYDIAIIRTDYGDIYIRFHEEYAPRHAANFKKLARQGFYDGTTFHRVVPEFVIQGGDPNSRDGDKANDGTGGPGYTIPAEIHEKHVRGAVAAARMPDEMNPQRQSSGSQFYICLAPLAMLDGAYTVYGQVVRGMEVADEIVQVRRDENDNPMHRVVMKKVEIRHVNPGETF